MIKKEYSAVLEIVKYPVKKSDRLIEVLEDKSLNWIEILGYLCYHRMAGIAYENINSVDVRKLDFPVFFTTFMVHQSQGVRTSLQKEHIREISSKLVERNIKHVFLKGSVLSGSIYPIGARASNDIDILVSKKSVNAVKEAMESLGFVQGKYDYKNDRIDKFDQKIIEERMSTLGELAQFVKIVNRTASKTIDVDVNFSLDWTPEGTDDAVNLFLDQRILTDVGDGFSIYSLRHEHLFIQLCSHLYKDAALLDIVKKRKVLDLYKFVDIYAFIQTRFNEVDPDEIFDLSVKYGFDKSVFFSLNYTSKLFPDLLTLDRVEYLLRKFKYINKSVMTTVFDQYEPKKQLMTTLNLVERIFAYNVIKKYR